MTANKCNTCFYAMMDKDLEAPCTSCSGYSNWVPDNMFVEPLAKPDFSTLSQSINNWFASKDVGYRVVDGYDIVTKPKHYMLFAAGDLRKAEGIEVRDVIEKLVNKIEYYPEGMFIADYVQLMQYLMRFMDKNGVEDLKKARWYLDKMIDSYESYV